MRRWLRLIPILAKTLLPLATVAGSVFVAQWLIKTKPVPPKEPPEETASAIAAIRAERRPIAVTIRSQGTVEPRTETTLIAQVPGRIVSVADSFDESGFFRKDDVLVQIDRRDYQLSIRRLEASLQAARARLAEASQRLGREQQLLERKATSRDTYERAQGAYEVAVAQEVELVAQLEEARNAEKDTAVVAPFDGCILQKQADVGQFVTAGTPLARCFATDAVEVRLPLDDRQFAYLELPLGATLAPETSPSVTLTTQFGGKTLSWQARVVRSEAMLDARSRMAYVVASVTAPYEHKTHGKPQPLAVGMFVNAEISSKPIQDAIVLPDSCVTSDGRLHVIDAERRLQPRSVEVLHRAAGWVLVQGDLRDDEFVCATQLPYANAGMHVEVIENLAADYASVSHSGVVDLSAGVQFRTIERLASKSLVGE
jgi:RND family efflux transporter MFP subunit